MRDSTYRYVVQILRDYKQTDRYIAKREEELMYPYQEQDENIGGGQSNIPGRPTERMAVTISEDRRLANLQRNRDVVDNCLNDSDIVTQELIGWMYLKDNLSTIRAAQETNISDRHARRLHSHFVEKIADELGLMK